MTTEEIHEMIQCADCSPDEPSISKLLNIMERMNGNIFALERRLEKLDKQTARTANIASCLANGIQPD